MTSKPVQLLILIIVTAAATEWRGPVVAYGLSRSLQNEQAPERGLVPLCPTWLPWNAVLLSCEYSSLSPEQFLYVSTVHGEYRSQWLVLAQQSDALFSPIAEGVYAGSHVRPDRTAALHVIAERSRIVQAMHELDERFFASVEAGLTEPQSDSVLSWLRAVRRCQYPLSHPLVAQIDVLHAHHLIMDVLAERCLQTREHGVYIAAATELALDLEQIVIATDAAQATWYEASFGDDVWVLDASNPANRGNPAFLDAQRAWLEAMMAIVPLCDHYLDTYLTVLHAATQGQADLRALELYVCGMNALFRYERAPWVTRFYQRATAGELSDVLREDMVRKYREYLAEQAAAYGRAMARDVTRPLINAPGLQQPPLTPDRFVMWLSSTRRQQNRKAEEVMRRWGVLGRGSVEHNGMAAAHGAPLGAQRLTEAARARAAPGMFASVTVAQPLDLLRKASDTHELSRVDDLLRPLCGDRSAPILDSWTQEIEALARKVRADVHNTFAGPRAGPNPARTVAGVDAIQRTVALLHADMIELDEKYLQLVSEDIAIAPADRYILKIMALERCYALWVSVDVDPAQRRWPWCVNSNASQVNLVGLAASLTGDATRAQYLRALAEHAAQLIPTIRRVHQCDSAWLFALQRYWIFRQTVLPYDATGQDWVDYNAEKIQVQRRTEALAAEAEQARADLAVIQRTVIDGCCMVDYANKLDAEIQTEVEVLLHERLRDN